MLNRFLTQSLCGLIALAGAGNLFAAEEKAPYLLEKPAYPLFGMVRISYDFSEADLRFIADNYQLVTGQFTTEQIKTLKKFNPDIKVVQYTNSTYTRTAEDVTLAESKYRDALAVHLSAILTEDVSAEQTKFKVKNAPKDERPRNFRGEIVNPNFIEEDPEDAPKIEAVDPNLIAIKASTMEGDFSSTTKEKPGTKFYVTWIRIGNELMRVNAFDQTTGVVEVTRGFHNTKPAPYKTGDKVFSPVYLGYKRLHINKEPGTYPGGPGERLRYVLDGQSSKAAEWKSQIIMEYMAEGFDGAWLDILSSSNFNMSDCHGRAVWPWNFEKNTHFVPDDWRHFQEKKIADIQEIIKKKTGRYPFLVGNNYKANNWKVGTGGERNFLVPTEIKPRPVDGMVMEYFTSPAPNLMDAAKHNLMVLARDASHHGKTPEERQRKELYAYVSYLFCVEANDRTQFGKEVFDLHADKKGKGNKGMPLQPISKHYLYPIGKPTESVESFDQLSKYLVKGTDTRLRHFTNGIILQNPSEKSNDVKLDGEYLDPETGETVNSVSLVPASAKILLKKK